MKRCVGGIKPRTVLHSGVFVVSGEGGIQRGWMGGFEDRCVKERGKERKEERAGGMPRDEGGERGETLRINVILVFERIILAKGNIGERGHVC